MKNNTYVNRSTMNAVPRRAVRIESKGLTLLTTKGESEMTHLGKDRSDVLEEGYQKHNDK